MLSRLSVVLVCAVLLAGCGGEPVAEEDKILIPSTSSPLGPSDGGKGAPSAQARPKEKKQRKANVVVAARAGIRFTAPAGWAPWTAKDLQGTARSTELQELLDRMGLTREQFASSLDDFDVFLVGLSGNLNVSTAGTSLPSEAEMRSQYATVTSSIDRVEDVDTAAGPGRVIHYSITAGSLTQHGASLMILTGGRVANLTITTADSSETSSRLADLLPTIRRA